MKFTFTTTERLCRQLSILHQNMVVPAERAQAHSPAPFSCHPKFTTNRHPLWPNGAHGARMDVGRGLHRIISGYGYGLGVIQHGTLGSRTPEARRPGGYRLQRSTIPCTAESSLQGKKHRQRRPGRGALKQCAMLQTTASLRAVPFPSARSYERNGE